MIEEDIPCPWPIKALGVVVLLGTCFLAWYTMPPYHPPWKPGEPPRIVQLGSKWSCHPEQFFTPVLEGDRVVCKAK